MKFTTQEDVSKWYKGKHQAIIGWEITYYEGYKEIVFKFSEKKQNNILH